MGKLLENTLRRAPALHLELVCEIEPNQVCIGVLDSGPGFASDPTPDLAEDDGYFRPAQYDAAIEPASVF